MIRKILLMLMTVMIILSSAHANINDSKKIEYDFAIENLVNDTFIQNIAEEFNESLNAECIKMSSSCSLTTSFKDEAIIFDGKNDKLNIPDKISVDNNFTKSISYWIWVSDFNNNPQTIIGGAFETNDQFEIFNFDNFIDDDIQTNRHDLIIDIAGLDFLPSQQVRYEDLQQETWYHVGITINDSNISMIVNSSGFDSVDYGTGFNATQNYTIGNNVEDSSGYFKGAIDEYKVFNDVLTEEEFNSIMLSDMNGDNVANVSTAKIISSTSPTDGSNFDFKEEFDIITTLNNQSSQCDLYIDYSKVNEFNDITSFSTQIYFEESGEHNYYVTCSYIENQTKYYDMSEVKTININEPDDTEVVFNVHTQDFNTDSEQLYIHTPCLERGAGSSTFFQELYPYRSEVNPQGATFRKITDENSIARFNLSSGNHTFCMLTGSLNYDSMNQTSNYQIYSYEGFSELGTFEIPVQDVLNYEVGIESLDAYSVTNPKAWGQTWQGVFTSIILIILGVLVIILGATREDRSAGKIVFAGSMMILAGFGINLNIFTGVLF